nr:poly [ADP-ribose] polymerase tankyrase-like isoform X3 [Setaria viridis]
MAGWSRRDGGMGVGNSDRQMAASLGFIASAALGGRTASMSSESADEMKRSIMSSDCNKASGRSFMGKGKMDTCQHLVENLGFDVNIPANDGSGKTPLACSVSCGQVIAVRYLLHKGADLNKQDVTGFAPLHYAAKRGYDGIARLLLSRGANVDVNSSEGTPLHVAAAHGKFGVMQILLEHHAHPDRVSPDHCTPLAEVLCAANEKVNESGCLKCMNLLVKAGADLNSTDPDTPLVIATSKGLTGCVDYLLEVGADANVRSKDGGRRPIEIAAKSGRRGLVESLLPFTSPIRTVSDWSVEGIIAYARSRPTEDKGQESDEDSNIQQNLRDESAVREDAGASRACTKDKLSDEDRKAQLKLHGGKAVSRMDYTGASKFYTEAIMLDPADATLYSNRSFCHLKIGEKKDALVDANACISLRPEWPKGYYRKGAAHMSLKEYKEARDAFMDGLKLDPSNLDIQNAYWEADEAMIKKHSAGQSIWPFA